MKQPKYDVFLSYTSADRPAVEELARRLKDQGIAPWLDKWNINAGDDWQEKLEAALDACKAYAIFIGPSGIGPWQNEEMRSAIEERVSNKKPVIPVFLPGGQREQQGKLPRFLRRTEWVDFRRSLDDDVAFRKLKAGIRDEPMEFVVPIPSELLDVNPYPGLKTYQPEDAKYFFGRKALTDELLESLRPSQILMEEYRFLAIIGASGSGKSSLARAGLLPALKSGALDGSEDWPVVIFRPGSNPVESLALALGRAHISSGAYSVTGELIKRFQKEPRTLHWITKKALDDTSESQRICLLVDQFEELFTLCDNEASRQAFIDNLHYAATVALGRTIVVLTMRADFYGKCAAYPDLAAAMTDRQVLVGTMTEDELRLAIERPAQMVGCEVETGLVELLLQDAGTGVGTLPLLQHVLRELWEQRTGRRLTVDTYRAMGKLEGALKQQANKIYDSLDNSSKEACKQLFLSLTQPGMGTEDTKRRATFIELGMDATDSLIQKLQDARLIVTEGGEGTQENGYVEVSHETLIKGWPQLQGWINENRDMIRIRNHLTDEATIWDDEGRKVGYLYQGSPLNIAEDFFRNQHNNLNKLQQEFLDASIKQRDKLKEEKKTQLKQKHIILIVSTFIALCLAAIASYKYIDAEIANKKALRQLAENNWMNGVTERDRNNNPVIASHYFIKAAELWSASELWPLFSLWYVSDEPNPSNNAQIAGNFLVRKFSLNSVSKKQAGVMHALLDKDRQRVIAWDKEGVVYVWSGGSNEWTRLEQLDFDIAYVVPGHDRQKILILGDTGKARLLDTVSREWFDINHNGSPITHATFSTDDSQLLTWSNDAMLQAWDTNNGQAYGPLLQHQGEIAAAGFSPDGQRVLAWSKDGNGRIWTLPEGETEKSVTIDGTLWRAIFSPDKRRVLILTEDGAVQIRDSSTLSLIPTSAPFLHMRLSGAEFSPDGEQLLTWSSDGSIWHWDYSNAQAIALSHQYTGSIGGAVFTQDGNRVLVRRSVKEGGLSYIWDLENDAQVILEHAEIIRGGRFSKDGNQLLTWNDKGARLWESRSGRLLIKFPGDEDKLVQAELSNDDQQILTWRENHTARVWNIESIMLPMASGNRVHEAVFTEDGSRILILGIDGKMRIWDSKTGEPVGPDWGSKKSHGLQVSENGERILTRTGTTTQVWKSQSTQPPVNLDTADQIQHALFTRKGKFVLTWGGNSRAVIWDSDSGIEVKKLGQISNVHGAEFSQDDRQLLIWDLDGKAQLLDSSGWGTVKTHEFNKPIHSGVFSSDGNSILICSGSVWYWKHKDMKPELVNELGLCEGAGFSQDDQRVLAWNDNTAQILNLKNGKLVALQQERIKGAMFVKDWVLTWSGNAARLWGAEDGRPLTPVLIHDGPVSGIVPSRNQQQILTWSNDATVRLWRFSDYDYSPGEPLLTHEIRTGSVLDGNKNLRLISAREWTERKQQ